MSRLNNREFIIQPRQGTSAGLTAYAGLLYEGELAYTTDTNELYIGNAAGNAVLIGSGPPPTTPAALTTTDDTNVTLTLGGLPAVALLQATSITAGWAGTLAVARGGTGAGTAAAAATALGVGTGDSPQFTAVNIGDPADTTITRVSPGVIAVEGATLATVSQLPAAASTTVSGISEMATFAENITGTDATRALTPDSQHTKITHLGTQHSNSTATPTEVTGLTQTLVAGSYRFSFWLICQSATAGTGITFNVNFTGTVTRMVAMLTWPDTGVSAALGAVDDVANAATGQIVAHAVTTTKATSAAGNLTTGTAGVATAGGNVFLQIEGVVVVSTGGSFALWHGSETTTATTVEVGSSLMMTRCN